jgi:hypothetical protein
MLFSNSIMACGVRTPFVRDGVCRKCASTFNCLTRRRHHCRRCGESFCARCSGRRARLVLWGFPRDRVRVCQQCHMAATEESDLVDRFLPLLMSGAAFRKHGTIFVTAVRCVLHPSCRRLEYWSPPEARQRRRANEVKGCDVETIHSVVDSGGLSFKVKGADAGSAKTMSLEALDAHTKREWLEALSLLCKYRTVVSSRGFSRHVLDGQIVGRDGGDMYNSNSDRSSWQQQNNNVHHDNYGRSSERQSLLRQQLEQQHQQQHQQQQQQHQQHQQRSLSPARRGSEAPVSGSKWEVRRKARAERRKTIHAKYHAGSRPAYGTGGGDEPG